VGCFDVVYLDVAHCSVDSRGARQVWELGEEIIRRCAAPNGFYARVPCGCRLCWYCPGSCCCGSRPRVWICLAGPPDDWDLDVGHHETPGELPSKSEVEREGVQSVGRDGCTVSCEEIVASALHASWDEILGTQTEVRTGVDQESQVSNTVDDE